MFIAVIHALYIFSLFKLFADSISAITDIGITYPDERRDGSEMIRFIICNGFNISSFLYSYIVVDIDL